MRAIAGMGRRMSGFWKAWGERFLAWYCQIENEIMIPFLLVGILVIGAFGAISYYGGYTMQRDNQRTAARTLFYEANRDLQYLSAYLEEEVLAEKYREFQPGRVRITDRNGNEITRDGDWEKKTVVAVSIGENPFGWKFEYLTDREVFLTDLLEKQNYTVVGAIASLILISQASIFIAHSMTRPIRRMSRTCREIDRNKGSYRSYAFEAVSRRDEIGQLAQTFEGLLKNMDNYTKMEYTSRMSAALAHEIKNPIAGIRSGIQLLKGRAQRDGDRMLCDSMIHEIDRVTTLIMNLFSLSVRRDSPKADVSLARVLGELALIYEREPGNGKAAFEVTVSEGLHAWINENEFRQIAHNLLSNSLKAVAPDGSGRIWILAKEENGRADVCFGDNGRGMTPEELARAMEPFYTRSINGIGLGLAIVKNLTEQNGGTMEMESAPGGGTQVTLRFPLRKEDGHGTGADY